MNQEILRMRRLRAMIKTLVVIASMIALGWLIINTDLIVWVMVFSAIVIVGALVGFFAGLYNRK